MAKQKDDEIKRRRLPGEPVVVNSKAYGKHERAPRFTHTPKKINASLKKFVNLNSRANAVAKAINDAFKPFSEDVKDGKMWSRLVGILKKDLSDDPEPDLRFLTDFNFKESHRFHRLYSATLLWTLENSKLHIDITSRSNDDSNKYKATDYEQTIAVVFMDRHMTTLTKTHCRILPVEIKQLPRKRGKSVQYQHSSNNDVADFDVPLDTVNILIGVRCQPLVNGICKNPAATAFGVLEVIETIFITEEKRPPLVLAVKKAK